MSVSHTYNTVFACICTYSGKCFLAPAARAHLLARVPSRWRCCTCSLQLACVQVRGRCTFATEASLSRRKSWRRRIIIKFIWIGSSRLGSGSIRQLEQQQVCCALKCLGAERCQQSTSRRQRNNIDGQNK